MPMTSENSTKIRMVSVDTSGFAYGNR